MFLGCELNVAPWRLSFFRALPASFGVSPVGKDVLESVPELADRAMEELLEEDCGDCGDKCKKEPNISILRYCSECEGMTRFTATLVVL